MKYFLSILAAVAMFVNVNAQDRSRNVWCFGDSVELDFNSGSPVSVSGSAMSAFEGCSSVADKTTGALLFYTDGISVWDSTNNIMPSNTQSLGGGFYAATQSALIVPVPGSTTQYYIFTVDFQGGVDFFFSGTGGVSYSIIDMSLNGGLGDVLQQPQILTTPTCEKICATKMPNNAGYWLVTHQYNSKKFFSYAITASGIGAAVTSNLGITIQDQGLNGAEAIGYMKISPDGSKIAVAHDYYYHTVQVFNFNNVTGLITGNVLSDNTLSTYSLSSFTYSGPYGLSFSPNSKLLYVTAEGDSSVYQYNLAAGNSAAVLASRNVVGVATAPFALQLAPDLKVYVIDDGTGYLDRIDNRYIFFNTEHNIYYNCWWRRYFCWSADSW